MSIPIAGHLHRSLTCVNLFLSVRRRHGAPASAPTLYVAFPLAVAGGGNTKWRHPMAVGRGKGFNDEKGWGFIKQDAGPDVFVHYSQIQGDGRRRLYEDELVEFEIKEGPKGLQAVNVSRQDT